MSQYSTCLASNLCGGSTRKLIAGWWYSILAASLLISLLAFWTASTRSRAEGFVSFWSALMVVALCIGGTMIMRKFHNSIAVGFFMGCVVAMSQLFLLLCLIYIGFASERREDGDDVGGEMLSSFFCLAQSLLLASFAAMLGAHRSQILDQNSAKDGGSDNAGEGGDDALKATASGDAGESVGDGSEGGRSGAGGGGYSSPAFL